MKRLKSQALYVLKLAKSFIAYRLGHPQITYVVYTLTSRCNLKCLHCDTWLKREKELDTVTNLAIIDKMAKAGVACINFSGGEPLLRDDLEVLASHAKKYGIISILNTNGTLITPERARKLDKCFEAITVSIDGFEDTHDKIRGIKGTFKKAMRAVSILKEEVIYANIGVNVALFRENINEIVPLFEYLQDKVDFVSFQPVWPYPPSEDITPPREEVERVVQSLLALKERNPGYLFPTKDYICSLIDYFSGDLKKYCDAGELYCIVDWNGNVMLCPMLTDYSMGSILEKGLKEVIREKWSEAILVRNKCKGCLSTCTAMPSMLYDQRLLDGDVLGQVANWIKLSIQRNQ